MASIINFINIYNNEVTMKLLMFSIAYIWYMYLRDTLLIFEQFFYVSLLSGLVPGTIFFMEWLING